VINYNGSNKAMNELMARAVDFGAPPAGTTSWSSSYSVKAVGDQWVKTATITYNLKNGKK
jgi:hypothetical protein